MKWISFYENIISRLEKFTLIISSILAKLSSYADSKSLTIHTQIRDVEKYPPGNAPPSISDDDDDRKGGQR